MPETFITNGKEVLGDGVHFADGDTPEAATLIVQALGEREAVLAHIDLISARHRKYAAELGGEDSGSRGIAAQLDALASTIRAGLHREDEPAPEGERARYNEETSVG